MTKVLSDLVGVEGNESPAGVIKVLVMIGGSS